MYAINFLRSTIKQLIISASTIKLKKKKIILQSKIAKKEAVSHKSNESPEIWKYEI